MIRKLSLLFAGALMGASAVSLVYGTNGTAANAAGTETYRQLAIFGDIFERVRAQYVTPPDEKEYAKQQKELKKRSPYDRSHVPILKGDIKFYDNKVEGKKLTEQVYWLRADEESAAHLAPADEPDSTARATSSPTS
jgi:hypothetical protein